MKAPNVSDWPPKSWGKAPGVPVNVDKAAGCIPGLRAGSTFMGESCGDFKSLDYKSTFINPPFNEFGCTGAIPILPPPHIEIGSAHRAGVDGSTGIFKFEWPTGYLESLPEGPVELASTVSAGVEYRFSVCRVGDVADKEV